MWKLVIEDDEGKRTVVPLSREQYSLGRKEGNTIRLTERNVSREHARLVRKVNGAPVTEKPSFVLEDLTSYNGVFVNGLRITHSQDLAHGDLVQIGDYRIILQDELVTEAGTAPGPTDAKATMPEAPRARGSSLLDRPNRLVMLAGPSPGTEYPLTDERMTIGRAEDATVSVNHNSVSRLHCEVHALGDGRFEIVDKGSSNGVRVNGADLRRGIVEPGDLIELGDVKFKFVGAGQVFRPTESQQLAILNDRAAAEIVHGRRGATALPFVIFTVVVLAGAVGAWVYTRPHVTSPSAAPMASALTPDEQTLAQALSACATGDCEGAHQKLATLPEGSPVRASHDFRGIEDRWADQVLAAGDAEPDVTRKRAIYQRVAQAMTVEASRRKAAADKLQTLDAVVASATATPTTLPVASVPSPTEVPMTPRPDAGRRVGPIPEATSPTAMATPLPTTPAATVMSATSTPKPTTTVGSSEDRERQLALQGGNDSKTALKTQLEQKVYTGRATDSEIRLLISTCKELGDKLCVAQARQQQGRPPQ